MLRAENQNLIMPSLAMGAGEQQAQAGFGDVQRAGEEGKKAAIPKRRFMKPPVKNACLPCRASRIRCDGQLPCLNCTDKHKSCRYEKSRRGGPRIPANKKKMAGNATLNTTVMKQEPTLPLSLEDQFVAADVLKDAGAGLRLLDELQEDDLGDFDFVPDLLQPQGVDANTWDNCGLAKMPDDQGDAMYGQDINAWAENTAFDMPATEAIAPEVRTYESEAELLDAYYVWIHAYFPVLPPPVRSPIDQPKQLGHPTKWTPSTPIALAISAVLALIPLPTDPNSRTIQSTWERRCFAHKLAQDAMGALDSETEMLDSMINPKDALSNGPEPQQRTPFHPRVPVDLEANITLMLLAVYEYTQRGNIKKMMNRGGQSLMLALDAKLYQPKNGFDEFDEARRRVWWATYINVCQGSIASNTSCAIELHDMKFTIGFPNIASDLEAFPFFIKCQQAIVDATQFVIDHTEILERGGDLDVMNQRTLELEDRLAALSINADRWFAYDRYPVDMPVDGGETVVAKTLRSIARMKINSARIKLHRYSAFIDKPIFTKRHCDLEPRQMASPETQSSASNLSSNFSGTASSTGTAETSVSNISTPYNKTGNNTPNYNNQQQTNLQFKMEQMPAMCNMQMPTAQIYGNPSPGIQHPKASLFSSEYSTKICCKAALNIAETFAVLPYPNPSGMIRTNTSTFAGDSNFAAANFGQSLGMDFMSLGGHPHPNAAMNPNMGSNSFIPNLDLRVVARQQQQYPPRTMPTFACCAMQSAYASLMLLYKVYVAKAQGQVGQMDYAVVEHVEKLKEGLAGVAAALENWAGAFEAIDGMREEVANALEFNVVQFDGQQMM